MVSTFSWLDYSENDRRKMTDVISRFSERDTRDELGIGIIRDAFSDLFFPGTSTIQTRARYFLFIPWIYQQLEKRRIPSSAIDRRARNEEIGLIFSLIDSGEKDGVIGYYAKGALKRLASNIYWTGLGSWGICLFPGSQGQYHRYLDSYYRKKDQYKEDPDGDGGGPSVYNWHPGLPHPPDGFPKTVLLELTCEESDYLRERILHRNSGTLLAFLVSNGRITDGIRFPWEHPQYGEFPEKIKEQLKHARNFSEAIHGAALLYNLMLAKKQENDDRMAHYHKCIADWSGEMNSRKRDFLKWDLKRFWEMIRSSGAHIRTPTVNFVNSWLEIVLTFNHLESVGDSKTATDLIYNRERFLKRGQARLANPRALELWNGAAGTGRLDYRWGITQIILNDILTGLKRSSDHA